MSQGLERKSMAEKKKLVDVSIIQAHEEGSISLKHASIMLERTSLTVYCNLGADGLVHGNTGKEPHNKIDQSICKLMRQEALHQMPYSLAVRYLHNEGLEMSVEALRR